MSILKSMKKEYHKAKRMPFNDDSKIILMSDCHRGDGGEADNFRNNQNIFSVALGHYYDNGYTYIELGDGDELWANSQFSTISQVNGKAFEKLIKLYEEGRLYFIYGNHDMVKRDKRWVKKNLTEYSLEYSRRKMPLFPGIEINSSILLEHDESGKTIFLVHGHQVDCLNSTFWKLARFLVRYLWRPLEMLGMKDPWSPVSNYNRKSDIERLLDQWSKDNGQIVIAGHTHRTVFPDVGETLYFNDGCCVYPNFITGIEMAAGGISLVKWEVQAKEDGILYVDRSILKGPTQLERYFAYAEQ